MTVRELLKKLSKLPEKLLDCPVYVQGCNCDAPAVDIVEDTQCRLKPETIVMIRRQN